MAKQTCNPRKAIPQHKQLAGYAKGGSVHDDAAMDRALIKKVVKPSALTGKKCGGKVKK